MTKDEAIKRVKALNLNSKDMEALSTLVPEIVESEDEKIRKELLSFVRGMLVCHDKPNAERDEKYESWIAWLEKQGELKLAVETKVIIPKFRIGDIVKSKSQPMLPPRKIISIGKDCYRCEDGGCIGFAWEDDYEIVEQKSAEWSEEDEDAIGMAIIALEDMYDEDAPNTTYGGYNLPFNKAAERLKSLRPQNRWKPSDEQLKKIKE